MRLPWQVLAAFGGRSIYYSRWHKITHPELSDSNAGKPTLYLALFDSAGRLQEVLTRLDAKAEPRSEISAGFNAIELEAYLAREFGGFTRAAIRVYPFTIAELGLRLHPLLSSHEEFLNNPADYDAEEQESIREWIVEGCSELLYGNDYFLSGAGEVTSS